MKKNLLALTCLPLLPIVMIGVLAGIIRSWIAIGFTAGQMIGLYHAEYIRLSSKEES